MWEIVFDVETKKFFDETGTSDPGDLGVSIVSVYHRKLDNTKKEEFGKLESFWEKDFDRMWKIFLEADRIIGFNSISFDVRALKPYAPAQFNKLPHFDILEKVYEKAGHRVSLNALSRDTLNNSKTDSGANAIKYWNSGDEASLTKLRTYCEADVVLTKDLYDFGRDKGYLKYTDHWNTARQVEVDFSYPENFTSVAQTSLF